MFEHLGSYEVSLRRLRRGGGGGGVRRGGGNVGRGGGSVGRGEVGRGGGGEVGRGGGGVERGEGLGRESVASKLKDSQKQELD